MRFRLCKRASDSCFLYPRFLLAKDSGLSQNAILRIWHSFGLKPHLQDSFKLPRDPFFVEKVRDVVGLYLNPPEHTRAIVLCVDEKSQVQALDRQGLRTKISIDTVSY